MKPNFLPENLNEVIDNYPFYKKKGNVDFIFIHIPKTGGTSINFAFGFPHPNRSKNIKKHYQLYKIKPLIEKSLWESSFKFCFVRNPWDRLYSHYRFRARTNRLKKESHQHSFKEWMIYELTEYPKPGHLRPQLDWIKDEQGKIDVDFIGRFENLELDFKKICDLFKLKLKLPHYEKSYPPVNYRTQYDSEMNDLVAGFYRSDIFHFNYSF